MASGESVDEILLRAAWARLWTAGTAYYLPSVMRDGYTGHGYAIPPLDGRPISELGPFQLFKDPVLSYISIDLPRSSIAGLSGIQDGGLTYVDATRTLTLSVNFPQLIFSGDYVVSAGGLAGCAIATANGVLGMFSGAGTPREATAEPDPNLDLALQYRDRLSQNANGLTLVGTYYDSNPALNYIQSQENSYTYAWSKYVTNGKHTAYFANQTSQAADAPDDPAHQVGDPDYQSHSYYMEGLLLLEAEQLKIQPPEGFTSDDFQALVQRINDFASHTETFTGPMTVNAVTTAVQQADARAPLAARARPHPFADEARARAAAFFHAYHSGNVPDAVARPQAQALGDSQFQGTFQDTIVAPALTLTLKVDTSGTALAVEVLDISVSLGDLDIHLSSSSSPLFAQVQEAIGNAFVKDTLKARVKAELDSDDVKSYLQDRFNQALAQIFG